MTAKVLAGVFCSCSTFAVNLITRHRLVWRHEHRYVQTSLGCALLHAGRSFGLHAKRGVAPHCGRFAQACQRLAQPSLLICLARKFCCKPIQQACHLFAASMNARWLSTRGVDVRGLGVSRLAHRDQACQPHTTNQAPKQPAHVSKRTKHGHHPPISAMRLPIYRPRLAKQ